VREIAQAKRDLDNLLRKLIVQDKRRKTPIQPQVITPQELAERLWGEPFLTEIVEKGKVLYDAQRVSAAG